MKKLPLLLLIVVGPFLSTSAQTTETYNQESYLKGGLLGPSIAYEMKLSNNITINSEVGLSFSFGYGGNRVGWLTDYTLYAEVSPRYYYNFANRLKEDKSIKKFSGNYVALFTRAYLFEVFSSLAEEQTQYLIGPAWGMQRNIWENWYYNLQVGAGASISKLETEFAPILSFNIGFKID